jgi:dTDP-4-amino-4,6-dideoxygalactose transaminase
MPPQWAMTQNSLAIALSNLGEQESGTAKREEAIVAYREALKERTRARVPPQWEVGPNVRNVQVTMGPRHRGHR